MTVDLAPLINGVLIPLLTPVLLVAASWALKRVADYAHFQISDGQRQVLSKAIDNGIAYAEKALAGREQITTSDKVAAAVSYILPKVPGALTALKVTPEHLSQIITAKLPA